MKDETFEEFKNYNRQAKVIKINNTNKKNPTNGNSRLRSTEKFIVDNKLESVNKKFFRAQSSSFKFYQVKNKLSEISLMKNTIISEKKNYNILVIDKNNKKK
jgi:hypothetical protein